MKILRVNCVDIFPASKRASVEYVNDEGKVVLERLESVWEAVFHGSVAKFSFCSYVKMDYGGRGVCTFDAEAKRLVCKRNIDVL